VTEELPPIWALDKAAKAANYGCWSDFNMIAHSLARHSIIAHARTIAQYEQPPVDPDEEALLRVIDVWMAIPGHDDDWRTSRDWPATLAQFKKELGRD
jgi:hypothetical protein